MRFTLPPFSGIGQRPLALVWLLSLLVMLSIAAACNLPLAATNNTPTPVETDGCVKCDSLAPAKATVTPTVALTVAPTPTLPTPTLEISPYVEIVLAPDQIKVGETFTITGKPVRIGLPYYYLLITPAGGEAQPLTTVTHSGEIKPPPPCATCGEKNALVEVVSARGSMNQCEFTLRALKAGVYQFSINATGEVHSASGPMWAGGSSEMVTLTVQ